MTFPPSHVDDDEVLHRRIPPDRIKPGNLPSSSAFSHEEMSVDRAAYRTIEESLTNYEHEGLASLVTRPCRALSLPVEHDPVTYNVAHTLVKGKKTKGTQKALARLATMVKVPPSTNNPL